MKRWFVGIVIFLVVLVLLGVAAIQVVLWTDVPHRMVFDQLQRDTGLRIEAGRFRTGWGGSSNLEDVLLALPGDDEPFARLDDARIEHASLLSLLFGADIGICEIHVDGLSIKITQDAAGQWTFDRIGALTAPRDAPAPSAEPAMDPYANLEVVRISNARLEVIDQQQRTAVVEQIAFNADDIGPRTLKYEATAGATSSGAAPLRATGQIVTRGQWPHHVNLSTSGIRPWMDDWMQDIDGDFAGELKWEGRLVDGSLSGHLVTKGLRAAGYELAGAASIALGPEGQWMVPKNLQVVLPDGGERITLHSGEIRSGEEKITFDRLDVSASQVRARLTGHYDPKTESGAVQGQWAGQVGQEAAAHGGSFEASVVRNLGGLALRLNASTTGKISTVAWQGELDLTATGPQWERMDWTLAISDGEVLIDAGGPPTAAAGAEAALAPPTGRAAPGGKDVLDRLSDPAFVHGTPVDPPQLAGVSVEQGGSAPQVEQPAGAAAAGDVTQAPQITRGPTRLPLAGVAVAGRVRWPSIHLDRIRHGSEGAISGDGTINTQTMEWNANVTGKQVRLSPQLPVTDIALAVQGNSDTLRIEHALFTGEQHELSLQGTYALTGDSQSPVAMRIKGTWWDKETGPLPALSPTAGEAAVVELPEAAPQAPMTVSLPEDQPVGPRWTGRVVIEGALTGRVDDLYLLVDGQLKADALRMNGQPVRALTMEVKGRIVDDRITAQSGAFKVMDGDARMDFEYRLGGEHMDMKLQLDLVSLEALLRMVDPHLTMRGKSSAKLAITLPLDAPREVRISGDWRVEQFSYEEVALERLTGKLRTRRPGVIEMNPIEIVQKQGRARGAMAVDLRSGVSGRLKLRLTDWPLRLEDQELEVAIGGSATVDIDFVAPSFSGSFDVTADTRVSGHDIGAVKLVGEANREQVTLRIDGSRLLQGEAAGTMTLRFDQWWKSSGDLTWNNVQPAALVPWVPFASDIKGVTKGSIKFAPTNAVKAPEPLHITLKLESVDKLTYREVPLGAIEATVYGGQRRWVVEEMNAKVASGNLNVWASIHRNADEWRDHVVVKLQDLNLDELRLVFPDEVYNQSTPGLLTGTITAYGQLNEWATHGGGGTLRLRNSNLQNTDVMGRVLTAFGAPDVEAVGLGLIDLRFERGALWIDRLIYRNRATEILLNGYVADLRKGSESEIRAEALATLRLFKIDEPGTFESANRLLRAFQSNATAVAVTGTLGKPVVEQTIMRDLEGFFDRALGGDASK